MEQRRLRLGDILDDYCPRERRVTNHAVVAMVEEDVKQTRCTTCDAEHPYKGGQAPRRRKTKETPSALYKEVLAGRPDLAAPAAVAALSEDETEVEAAEDEPIETGDMQDETAPDMALEPETLADTLADEPDAGSDEPQIQVEEGPVHRPLIRAQLPRPEGQKDPRTPPDFTIRQSNGRNGNVQFRGGGNNTRQKPRGAHGAQGAQGNNGHRPQGGTRFGSARPGQGQGRGQGQGGFRSAQQPRHGGGRKRSR